MTQADRSSPELPHYDRLVGTGAVLARPDRLLHALRRRARAAGAQVDDRYVIMNAGDEIALRFARRPPAGGVEARLRLVCDGWDKDGDLNTRFSQDRPAAAAPTA